MISVFKTDYKTREFNLSIQILKMSPFKLLNFVVLMFMLLGHEVSAPENMSREQLACLRQIHDFFPGSNVLEHARYAIENYTTQTNFVGSARTYYDLIGGSLNEDSIISSEDFCATRRRRYRYAYDYRRQCKLAIHTIFPRAKRDILKFAFYDTNINDINVYIGPTLGQDESIREYFRSIIESITLNENIKLCLRQIHDFFPEGSNVLEHAKNAMENYTSSTNFLGSAREYYILLGQNINEDSIMSSEDFCAEYTRRDGLVFRYINRQLCKFAIHSKFPRAKIDIRKLAFYETNLSDMNVYLGTTQESIRSYFMSILESITLNENFPSPSTYCQLMFPSVNFYLEMQDIDNRNNEVNKNNGVNINNENNKGRVSSNSDSEEETGAFCYYTGR